MKKCSKKKNCYKWQQACLSLSGTKQQVPAEGSGKPVVIVLITMLVFFSFLPAGAAEKIQADSLLHLHTVYSSGNGTVEEVVAKARNAGDKILFLTDHDVIRMEYGIPPFRNILKKTVEQKSVNSIGPSKYLSEIKRVNSKYDDMIIIPGVESTAHYFWTGSFFNDTLVSNNWHKHITIIGLDTPEKFTALPVIHNGFSTSYIKELLPGFLPFIAAFILSFILYLKGEGTLRKIALVFMIISILFAINYHPFKSSMFSQYDSDAELFPYQELIDYAEKSGALSIWAHPESNYEERKIDSIKIYTPSHAEDLVKSQDYTGFEALYRDKSRMIESGKEWDTILLQYCNGERENPVWGVGGIDYHANGDERIDEVETVLLFDTGDTVNKNAVLDAIKKGHCYARRNGKENKVILQDFTIGNTGSETRYGMGELVKLTGNPELSIKIGEKSGHTFPFNLELIRNGRRIMEIKGEAPYSEKFTDEPDKKTKGYYRLILKTGKGDHIVSNPIFFDYSQTTGGN